MAPIHDTDVAEDRWAKAEWEHYELWEKVELKLRRRKWLWIAATVVVFLALSSVPIVIDRSPRWVALHLTRRLAEEVNALKRDAALKHQAYRIRFIGGGRLDYVVESLRSCGPGPGPAPGSVVKVREGSLATGSRAESFRLLSAQEGEELGVPGLVESFCYDFLGGSDADGRDEPLAGFGIVVAQDLLDHRTDRVAVLLASGPSAELAFE